MIIYLELLLPTVSSDLPESTAGNCIAFFLVLLRMGFTCALYVTIEAVVSYTAFPPLPKQKEAVTRSLRYSLRTFVRSAAFILAVYLCCTGLGVTSTGRYPASCPVKPGLSSPIPFRLNGRDHLFHSHIFIIIPGNNCLPQIHGQWNCSEADPFQVRGNNPKISITALLHDIRVHPHRFHIKAVPHIVLKPQAHK